MKNVGEHIWTGTREIKRAADEPRWLKGRRGTKSVRKLRWQLACIQRQRKAMKVRKERKRKKERKARKAFARSEEEYEKGKKVADVRANLREVADALLGTTERLREAAEVELTRRRGRRKIEKRSIERGATEGESAGEAWMRGETHVLAGRPFGGLWRRIGEETWSCRIDGVGYRAFSSFMRARSGRDGK